MESLATPNCMFCWCVEQRQALETSLDDVQRELVRVKGEQSEAVRSQAATETKADDLQVRVVKGNVGCKD